MEEELAIKGFNAGYNIEKHLPELAQQLSKGFQDSAHPFAEAFIKGAEEMTKERSRTDPKFLDRLMERLSGNDQPDLSPGKDEMDMDIDR